MSFNTNYILIECFKECINIVENILLNQEIIALDCEGVYLSKEGQLTLLQIGLSSGEVYIFDILKGGSLMFYGLEKTTTLTTNEKKLCKGLKHVLESKKIIKILHDCRSDWESLLYQYEIRLHNFIDTQEVYFIYNLFLNKVVDKPISLGNFIKGIKGEKLIYKQKFKNLMSENPEYWGNRPLDKEALLYAAQDVKYLINSWFIISSYLNENLTEMSYFLSIIKVINKDLFDQFKKHLVSSVLKLIECKDDNKNIQYNNNKDSISSLLTNYDYVENFFQFKKLYAHDDELNYKIDNLINAGLFYKNKQRDYFNKLIINTNESEK